MCIATGIVSLGAQYSALRQENIELKQTVAAQKEDIAKTCALLKAIIEKIKQNREAGLPLTDGWSTLSENTNKATAKE